MFANIRGEFKSVGVVELGDLAIEFVVMQFLNLFIGILL